MTMTATYDPADNKLRLSAASRFSAEMLARVKSHGFRWAPKQEIFVAPSWSPSREDFLLEICGEIEDESYSPEERAADRAERFSGYRDKRRDEAGVSADAFESGPSVFGHQNINRAERQAARHDRKRTYAVSQWSKAEYWQSRTASVIQHAIHKADPRVRRSRILVLEAEQRKHESSRAEYAKRFEGWSKVSDMEGADETGKKSDTPTFIGIDPKQCKLAFIAAYTLANSGCYGFDYKHPRTGKESSLYSHLVDEKDPITPREAAAIWLENCSDPSDETTNSARWSRHYELRLTYERAMLAQEGGSAADVDIIPGGWFGNRQVQRVFKSSATGRVTSVKVLAEDRKYSGEPVLRADGTMGSPLVEVRCNIQRLGESSYRAPTEEELSLFLFEQKESKKAAKAVKPTAIQLVNPTDEDAERLQAIWNEHGKAQHEKSRNYGEYAASSVLRMTQAQYSERSKGAYASYETVEVSERLKKIGRYHGEARAVAVFKVRKGSASGFNHSADKVIVLTDKPRAAIPWDAVDAARAAMPTEESVYLTLGKLAVAFANYEIRSSKEGQKLISDARYVGWGYDDSTSQCGFTEAGIAAYKKFREEANPQWYGTKSDAVEVRS